MTETSFEQAYQRLEEILEKLNSSQISLEDSLKYFEEANLLITDCEKKLQNAEKKIEILIKKREGSLQETQNGVQTEPFNPTSQQQSLTS